MCRPALLRYCLAYVTRRYADDLSSIWRLSRQCAHQYGGSILDGIPIFFAVVLFLATVVMFFSVSEGVTRLPVVLTIFHARRGVRTARDPLPGPSVVWVKLLEDGKKPFGFEEAGEEGGEPWMPETRPRGWR